MIDGMKNRVVTFDHVVDDGPRAGQLHRVTMELEAGKVVRVTSRFIDGPTLPATALLLTEQNREE